MHWKRALSLTLCAALLLLVVPASFAQGPGDASMDEAKRLYRSRDFRGALDALSRVLEAEPDRADALYLKGYSHVMLREYADAVDAFRRAFAAKPDFDPRTIYHPRPPAEEPTS